MMKTILKHVSPTLILVAAAASQMGATNCGQITRDPGFDLWCGDSLCAWKLERGMVLRVPTWNEGDPGVQLVGSDVAIEQLTPVTFTDGTCIEFDLIANVDPDAQVFLNTDVDGDGTLEQMEQLPTSSWKPLKYLISVTAPYAGIRFEIAKRGSGNAVLAQIDAKLADDQTACDGLTQLDAAPQPDGAPCDALSDGSATCASGICGSGAISLTWGASLFGTDPDACEGCDATSCGSGAVCGLGAAISPTLAVATACVPPASKQLGEECAIAAECASGICNNTNFCSACAQDSDCGSGGGQTCTYAWPQTAFGVIGPSVCAPNLGLRGSGESCASDADCASGTCAGAPRMQCDDGRACGNNADCPFGTGSNGALANGACATVGVQGGACQ